MILNLLIYIIYNKHTLVNNIKPIPDMKNHSLKTTHAFRLVVNSTVEPTTQTANYTKRDYELSDIF